MKSPQRSQPYDVCARKTFRSALCHLLETEFPGIFGPAVTRLFADKIDELYERFHPPRSRLKVGQVLWVAVAADSPPTRQQPRIEQARLVPVVLDLVTPQDIDAMAAGQRTQILPRKVLRLFRQAYEQQAVLSYTDVSLLLHLLISTISEMVTRHEDATLEMIPRRGTVHDMGRSITHKAIICYKRLVEKKSTSEVAEETFHSPEAVEYYVQCLRRIHMCHSTGMNPVEITQATGHTLSLVEEYLELIEKMHLDPLPNPHPEDTVQNEQNLSAK
jgi:hypothetical protein